ncbi:MAG: hypothetical protein QXH42_03645 [Thermoplasmata archaeon]
MVCLMPPQPSQSPYPPPPQPATYAMPPPPSGGPWTKGLTIVLALVGLGLFFVGMMVVSSTAFLDPPTRPEYGDDYGEYEKKMEKYKEDSEKYQDTIRNMGGAGRVVIEIGGLIATVAFITGGIAAEQINEKVRVGLVSAAVAVIVSTLVVLSIFSSFPGL